MRKRLVIEVIEHTPSQWLELYTERRDDESHFWFHITKRLAIHVATAQSKSLWPPHGPEWLNVNPKHKREST